MQLRVLNELAAFGSDYVGVFAVGKDIFQQDLSILTPDSSQAEIGVALKNAIGRLWANHGALRIVRTFLTGTVAMNLFANDSDLTFDRAMSLARQQVDLFLVPENLDQLTDLVIDNHEEIQAIIERAVLGQSPFTAIQDAIREIVSVLLEGTLSAAAA